MTGEEERGLIVAWLRALSTYRARLAERTSGPMAQFHSGMAQAYVNAIERINAGDHLRQQEKPTAIRTQFAPAGGKEG